MKTEVVKYTTNEAEIAKMSAIYMELTVKGLKEKAKAAERVRLEALKPDKELLVDYANKIIEIKHPALKNTQCQDIADNARVELFRISNDVIKQAKEL